MPERESPAAGCAARAGDRVCADEAPPLAALRRLRRRQQVEHIYALGSRVIFELIDEIDRHHGLRDDINQRLARYAKLDPGIVAVVGADKFPPLPVRLLKIADDEAG